MVTKDEFRNAAELAAENIIKHGDTDIFPYPFEHHAFFDKKDAFVNLIMDYEDNFDEYLARYSPRHVSSLTPVSYAGFRWATQLDPIWNAQFLSMVLSIANKLESARLPIDTNTVFSYRFNPDMETGDLFDRKFGWYQFMRHSIELSKKCDYVVICDISEFYPRLGHHRLENALKQVVGETHYPTRIMNFLSNYSDTRSFGLPIGGPASRILSEITINQIDRLLVGLGLKFTRFADDYHLFCSTREDSYRSLIFLSEKLFDNQGLSLQKSKTRIMSSSEFRSTNPLSDEEDEVLPEEEGRAAAEAHSSSSLLRFSLRFDPYSPTAEEDYDRLQAEIRKFDIIGILKKELSKSRIHTTLARKIIAAIQYLDEDYKDDAVLSILDNCDVLYPIFSSVLLMIEKVYDSLSEDTKKIVIKTIQELVRSDSHVLKVDIHLCFAVRVLARANTPENQILMQQLYEERSSPLIRRDIILIMTQWSEWYWLSDKRNRFRELSGPERRAFIAASYKLKDEGRHWREHIKRELSPFEIFIKDWCSSKMTHDGWVAPL